MVQTSGNSAQCHGNVLFKADTVKKFFMSHLTKTIEKLAMYFKRLNELRKFSNILKVSDIWHG